METSKSSSSTSAVNKFSIPLQPKQTQLYNLIDKGKASWIGFGGARGGSKSHGGRSVMMARRWQYPRTDGLIVRRTFNELWNNHIQPMFRQWPQTRDWYHGQSKTLRLPNGSNVVFGHAQHKGDIYNFRGQEYADIIAEEATHFTEEELSELKSCNRWTRSTIDPKFICTMNPGSRGHAFIKRIFIDKEYRENENPANYAFLQAYGWDNVEWARRSLEADGNTAEEYYKWNDRERFQYFITRSEYGKSLNAMSDQLRTAHLMGEWDQFAGQFFTEFSRRTHVIKPFRIPSYWERFASADWGFTAPACNLWHAVSPQGKIYTYRESYVTGKDSTWLGREWVKLTGDEKLRYRVLDPSCWDASRGVSIAEQFAGAGWGAIKAEHNRINGWARLREYLAHEIDAVTGEFIREPMWQIFETCTHLIRTLPALTHDDHDGEDADSDGEDHAADAARYGLMTRPKLTTVPLEAMDHEYAEATIRAAHRGR